MAEQLANDDEVLFRQVHPTFMQDGQPSSQPFMPTDKDNNLLSVDRSSLTTAEASYLIFTGDGNQSIGVYGINVGEFKEHALPCVSDPIMASENKLANPAHAYADYSQYGTNKQKTLAKRLKLRAIARGKLYSPT